jgi:hypothetical protein
VSFRALATVPALAIALVFLALLLTGFPPAALRVEIELVKLVAMIGSFAAAQSFERGEHLRRAWWLSGACIAFLLVRDVLVLIDGHSQMPLRETTISALVLASNASGVASAWLMAHTFQVAGLATDESTRKWRVYTVVALLASLVVTLPSLHLSVQGMLRGEFGSLVWFISGVGDVLALGLIAPILLTAIAMRGGALIWPWALLTVAMASWLFYDLAGTIEHLTLFGLGRGAGQGLEELFRALACVYTGVAGLAQRKIVREGAS